MNNASLHKMNSNNAEKESASFLLPVNDDGVWRRFVPIATTFLVATTAEKSKTQSFNKYNFNNHLTLKNK